MKALVFGVPNDDGPPAAPDAPRLERNLAVTPMALRDIAAPTLRGDDWMVLETRLTGICGSDSKQVLLDFGGDNDNPLAAFVSLPHVLGHEVVATVAEAGPAVEHVEVGDRVVLSCWLGCAARGISPVCAACAAGDFSICENHTKGRLAPGIHTGNSTDASGGFAERLPAHVSMVSKIPESIPDEVAVLADPVAVSLHAILRNPPRPGGTALVYGGGALGSSAVALLRTLHPDVDVAAVCRWDAQADLCTQLGARVWRSDDTAGLVEAIAAWTGGELRRASPELPMDGLPMMHPGGVDTIYDTIGSPETTEVAMRVCRARGTLVQLGVSSPGRFEWTPLYWKELRFVGSNAFGVEELDGVRKWAIDHYLDLVADNRLDVSAMLTHRFRLEQWRDAFTSIARQGETGAIKVAFDFR
jgi:threonine dehydrogenase-like Zn-dependent dehydrogenase